MIRYTDKTKTSVSVVDHTFQVLGIEIYVGMMTIPVGSRFWFEYELHLLAEQKLIDEWQIELTSLETQIASIDDAAAAEAMKWTRFAEEYKEREAAAIAYKEAGYTGDVSIYITSFSEPAGITNQAAADLILKQADDLRSLQSQLAAERMRKYELKQPDLTLDDIAALRDEIVANIRALGESYE